MGMTVKDAGTHGVYVDMKPTPCWEEELEAWNAWEERACKEDGIA